MKHRYRMLDAFWSRRRRGGRCRGGRSGGCCFRHGWRWRGGCRCFGYGWRWRGGRDRSRTFWRSTFRGSSRFVRRLSTWKLGRVGRHLGNRRGRGLRAGGLERSDGRALRGWARNCSCHLCVCRRGDLGLPGKVMISFRGGLSFGEISRGRDRDRLGVRAGDDRFAWLGGVYRRSHADRMMVVGMADRMVSLDCAGGDDRSDREPSNCLGGQCADTRCHKATGGAGSTDCAGGACRCARSTGARHVGSPGAGG